MADGRSAYSWLAIGTTLLIFGAMLLYLQVIDAAQYSSSCGAEVVCVVASTTQTPETTVAAVPAPIFAVVIVAAIPFLIQGCRVYFGSKPR